MRKIITINAIALLTILMVSCDYNTSTTSKVSVKENEKYPTSTLEKYLIVRLNNYPDWENNGAQQNEFNKSFEKELIGKLKTDKTFMSDYPFRFGMLGDKEINGKYGILLHYNQEIDFNRYRCGLPIDGDVIVLINKEDALSMNISEWEKKICSFSGSFVKVGRTPDEFYKYFSRGMPHTPLFGLSDYGSSRTEVNLSILIFKADSIFALNNTKLY